MSVTCLVTYAAGPDWRPLTSMREAPIPAHFAWVQGQQQVGTLLLAGPLTDAPGAVAVVRAESVQAVRDLLADDPAISSGYFQMREVRPFRMLVGPEGGVA